jgi:hypothetical protein
MINHVGQGEVPKDFKIGGVIKKIKTNEERRKLNGSTYFYCPYKRGDFRRKGK